MIDPPPFAVAPVSLVLLAAIAGASVLAFRNSRMLAAWMLRPYEIVHQKRIPQLISYGFVHGDVMHLLFNVVSMYSIAVQLEMVMGSGPFLFLYLGSLVLGALPTVIRRRNDPGYRALGASGAISGLFFAGMIHFPGGSVMLFFIPIPIPYPLFGLLFLAFSWYGDRKQLGPIGHDVHLYGAVAGFLLAALLDPAAFSAFISVLLPS